MPWLPTFKELVVYKEDKFTQSKIAPKCYDAFQPVQAQDTMTACFKVVLRLVRELNLCFIRKDKLSAL